MSGALLSVRDLTIRYGGPEAPAAVDGVSFDVNPGEIVALVGESGSGKSSVSLAVMSLLPDSAQVGGQILFEDRDLT